MNKQKRMVSEEGFYTLGSFSAILHKGDNFQGRQFLRLPVCFTAHRARPSERESHLNGKNLLPLGVELLGVELQYSEHLTADPGVAISLNRSLAR